MKYIKQLLSLILRKPVITLLFLLLQIFILVFLFTYYSTQFIWVLLLFSVLGILIAIKILNDDINPSFKIIWLIPIMIAPFFGALLYIFIKNQLAPKKINARLKFLKKKSNKYLPYDKDIYEELKEDNIEVYNLANYMHNTNLSNLYYGSDYDYFPLGEDMFSDMLEELENAKEFIFLEYFIIGKGYMWDKVLSILKEKVKEGLDVRVIYDGTCNIRLLPFDYGTTLEKMGIKCTVFSAIKPILSTHYNNRDHRKLLIIDGKIAYTGGINLADEYINRKKRFGHWKDTGIKIRGNAVNSFTMVYLEMWNLFRKEEEDFSNFIRINKEKKDGYIIPYGESPEESDSLGEVIYLDMINTAKDYVHIMTPYLVLDNALLKSLEYAAKRGVEVVISLPHIPDKKYIYYLARTHYYDLYQAGVKIYEYTPGFVHGKMVISDDVKCVIGTINFDYRSLYFNYEDAVYLYKNKVIRKVEKDFQETILKSKLITLNNIEDYNGFKKLAGKLLKLFAPFL